MTRPNPLGRLLRHVSSYRRRVALAATCSVLNKVFDLAPPALIGAAIDVVVERDQSLIARLGVDGVMAQLGVLTVVTVVIWALESAFEYAYAVLWRNLAQSVEHDLRVEAYAHVQDLEMAYFEDRSTGGLMAILNDDVNQLERFLDVGANQLLQVATTVVVVGATFFAFSVPLALMAFVPVPLVLWGSIRFQRRVAPRYAVVREKVGELNAQLANNLGGITTIKSFTSEGHEVARIAAASDAYRQANERAIRLSSGFIPLIRMVIVVGFGATMFYGGWLVESGTLAVGAYGVLIFLTQRLLWPLTRLGETLDLYQRAMASTDRILDLLDTPRGIEGGEVALPVGQVEGAITLERVDFAYPTVPRPVLEGLDLAFAAGTTTGIVGSTGSGKSTLIKLLLRFYDVSGGTIRLDGHDIRSLRLRDLRGAIGLVSQDVFLFHGSVRENIEYGSFGTPFDRVVEAARLAEAHAFIEALPQGYETIVGERGQKLSGGQRQRLSIARAILKDPPILVLDEATSSVDNETEAAIQRSLEHLSQGRTTLVIAHRLSTVRDADRIVVLEQGRVVEDGDHDALIAADGTYAALWRVQSGEASHLRRLAGR